jgi:hypothetical protein
MSHPNHLGGRYWLVQTPTAEVHFHAEKLAVVQDGSLLALDREGKPHLGFRDWIAFHAASVIDGGPCTTEHWRVRTDGARQAPEGQCDER